MLASVNFNSGTGALVVVGNAIADTISLTNSADHQSFTVDINNNASLQQTFNYSDVTSVRVVAGDGDDFVYNTLLMDTEIFGQNGNDHLEGGYANDLVMGGNGIDTLVGRNGDDVLNGQDGDDWLFGGPGVDDLSGITGNDNLYGGTGDDTLNGHGGNDSLWGEAGNDSLLGGAGDDLLRGQNGDDTIRGEAGDDWLVGGNGDDTLHGDAGVDELLGQDGNDILNGGADNDFIWGAAGDDTIRGNSGSDRLNGGSGNDLIFGDDGRDIIRGDGGDDTLRGGDGDDDLFGLGGTDNLFGDSGDDLLDAGGDVAADVLTGGSGIDRFVVLGNFGTTSVDLITDLEALETINGDTGGGDSGDNPGDDDDGGDGSANLAPFPGVLGLFGVGLTDSVSSLQFDAAVAAFGAGTDVGFGVTVFDVGLRKIAVQSTGGGFTGVGETSLLATFPADFPAQFASSLIPFSNNTSTIHVELNSSLGAGTVNRISLDGGGNGDFIFDQIGIATLGIDIDNLSIDNSYVDFVQSDIFGQAPADERVIRTAAESLALLGITTEMRTTLTSDQETQRLREVAGFGETLRDVIATDVLHRLRDTDGNRFFIRDNTVSDEFDIDGNLICSIRGGFDCDDYAEAARNFINSHPDIFQVEPASVMIFGGLYNDSAGTRRGHAVNVIEYRPPVGGRPVYFGFDPQRGSITNPALTPQLAVSASLLQTGRALVNNNPLPPGVEVFHVGDQTRVETGITSFLENETVLTRFIEAVRRAGGNPDRYLPTGLNQ